MPGTIFQTARSGTMVRLRDRHTPINIETCFDIKLLFKISLVLKCIGNINSRKKRSVLGDREPIEVDH